MKTKQNVRKAVTKTLKRKSKSHTVAAERLAEIEFLVSQAKIAEKTEKIVITIVKVFLIVAFIVLSLYTVSALAHEETICTNDSSCTHWYTNQPPDENGNTAYHTDSVTDQNGHTETSDRFSY